MGSYWLLAMGSHWQHALSLKQKYMHWSLAILAVGAHQNGYVIA
jgi:hypothetical protein